jgi:hypothetical protein
MAFKRNLAFPLAPTVGDDKKKKKKKKKTVKNPDGTITTYRTRRSGDIVKKTTTPSTKSTTPPSKPEPKRTRAEKKKDKAQSEAINKKFGFGKYEDPEKRKARKESMKAYDKQNRKRRRTARKTEREVIKAEKSNARYIKKVKKGKSPKVKLKGKRGAYKGKGGSEVKFCKPGASGKRKACKHNVG